MADGSYEGAFAEALFNGRDGRIECLVAVELAPVPACQTGDAAWAHAQDSSDLCMGGARPIDEKNKRNRPWIVATSAARLVKLGTLDSEADEPDRVSCNTLQSLQCEGPCVRLPLQGSLPADLALRLYGGDLRRDFKRLRRLWVGVFNLAGETRRLVAEALQ